MVGEHHRFIARTGPDGVQLVRDFEGMYAAVDDPHGQRVSAVNLAHEVYSHLIAGAAAQMIRPGLGGAPVRYLDMGCGLGFFTRRLVERLRADGPLEAHGADVAASAVARARTLENRVTFHVASLLDPGSLAPLGRCHLVTCLETLYYFQDEEIGAVVANLLGLGEPGGVLAVSYHLPATMSYGRYVRSLADLRARFEGCRPLWEMDFADELSTVYDGSRFGRHLFAMYQVPTNA